MKVVYPVTIGPTQLTATNVAATGVAAWSAVATYSVGQQVSYNRRIYESLQGSNLNKQPDLAANDTWWVDLGAENRWAMFDEKVGTQTTNANSIVVTVVPGARVSTLGLLNIEADNAVVVITSAAFGVVYNETISLVSTTGVGNAWRWLMEPIRRKGDLIIDGFQNFSDLTLEITLNRPGGTAKCGSCVMGQATTIGETGNGAKIGIVDYSRKDTDDFGNYTIIQRAFAKRGNYTVLVAAEDADYVGSLLAELRTTPVLWVASSDYGITATLGFYKDWNIELNYGSHVLCSLEIEGLT